MRISRVYNASGGPVRKNGRNAPYGDLPDPATFDVNKLQTNEIRQENGPTLAKIPNAPEIRPRIFLREQKDRNNTYVEFVTDRYYDKEKKQTRTTKVIIGTDISGFYPGMMMINENYYEYFDRDGNLVYDPMQIRKEKEAREAKATKQTETTEPTETTNPNKTTDQPKTTNPTEPTNQPKTTNPNEPINPLKTLEPKQTIPLPGGDNRTVDEIRASLLEKEKLLDEKLKKAKVLNEKLQETQRELDHMISVKTIQITEAEKAHMKLLDNMLDHYLDTVNVQAKHKPDAPMSLRQIRMINDLLAELRDYFGECETANYLHLAEEPRHEETEDIPGTTYGEMAILLTAYSATLGTSFWRPLYAKPESQQ